MFRCPKLCNTLVTESAKFLARALLRSTRHAAMRRDPVWLSVNPWRTTSRIAAQVLVVDTRSRSVLLRKLWSPFWEHVSVPNIMQYPCDGECQVFLYARAALIDSARRDTSRPCAFEGGALTRGFANCRTDINRQRTVKRDSDAQAGGTVLGTRFDQHNF